jgi:hypothetical protein
MAIQQGELVKQMQAKLKLTENETMDISPFQAQALGVQEKLELVQQNLFIRLESIQNYYRSPDHSLNNIFIKEREANTARVTFQEVILSSSKEGVANVTRLSLSEQTQGDIILKTWEANIVESKRLTKEVKKYYEQYCSSLNKESLDIEVDNISEALGKIDIAKYQLTSKTSMEEARATIL